MKKPAFFAIAILIILVLFSGCSQVIDAMSEPVDPNDDTPVMVEVFKGATTSTISKLLKEKELIKSDTIFKTIAKDKKADGKMKAGTYKLNKTMSAGEIIDKLVAGDIYIETFSFTIPEGFEVRQIIERLEKEKLIEKGAFESVLTSGEFEFAFLEDIDPKTRLEGFLFPETYTMEKGSDEKAIVHRMLAQFDKKFKPEYYKRAQELGMSINQVITLASIVEREAGREDERAIVSGVFHNRLKKKWKLQSCATVQYILEDRKPVLTFDDIAIDSPFNTYENSGLPPAPIASPGEASIRAALYPEKTDYMFFVTAEDGTGGHIFSKTKAEHDKAVKSRKK